MSLAGLGFLIGVWTCNYAGGGQHLTYTATFDYDLANNWIRERDAWPGGGGDVAYLTYFPKDKMWTYGVFESERTTTLFRGTGSASHIVYRSVYPDASFTDVFDRVTPTKYTLHFSGMLAGKPTTSVDVCIKH